MSITATQSYGLLQTRPETSSGAAADVRTGSRTATTSDAKATSSAVSVKLSAQAKAALLGSNPLTIDAPKSLDEIIQKRSDAFTEKLTDVLKKMGIPDGEEFVLALDDMGNVKTDSPYKKKIEEYFEHNPEAAKELKEISKLHALKAAQEALALFVEEKQAAKTDDEKAAAYDRYTAHSINIQNLSGLMTFKDGTLSSAARQYVDAITPPDSKARDADPNLTPTLALIA